MGNCRPDCLSHNTTCALLNQWIHLKMGIFDNQAVVLTVVGLLVVWLVSKVVNLVKDRQRLKKMVSRSHSTCIVYAMLLFCSTGRLLQPFRQIIPHIDSRGCYEEIAKYLHLPGRTSYAPHLRPSYLRREGCYEASSPRSSSSPRFALAEGVQSAWDILLRHKTCVFTESDSS
jgi:hypothetical protein